jgi:glycosyltransferase domain-containing protein
VLNRLTIIIITYRRYPFLKRLLKFYETYQSEARFLVLDSSSDYPEDPELKELLSRDHVTWKRFDSTTFFAQKISEGCKHIETEYAVLCADDDFLIPTALTACINFLAEHMDYASTLGLDFLHSGGPEVRTGFFRITPLSKGSSSEEKTALERIQSYLSGKTGRYPMYAVHRTSTFCNIWNETTKYVTDWGLSELFPCSLSFAFGKMKILPVFYVSREPNSYNWYDERKFNDMFSDEKLGSAVTGLSKYLSKKDGLSQVEAESLSRYAIDTYLKRARKKQQKLKSIKDSCYTQYFVKVRHKLRIRTRAVGLMHYLRYNGCHPSIYPEYLEDFKRVKNAVLSANLTEEELNESRKDYAKQGDV